MQKNARKALFLIKQRMLKKKQAEGQRTSFMNIGSGDRESKI